MHVLAAQIFFYRYSSLVLGVKPSFGQALVRDHNLQEEHAYGIPCVRYTILQMCLTA